MSVIQFDNISIVPTTDVFSVLREQPLMVFILVLIGIATGLLIGFLYSSLKTRFSNTQADRRLKTIVANFEQEKGASETIIRELQVGILAYGGDGRLISENPSAHAILSSDQLPLTLPLFLAQYGEDNGIKAALVLQTPNINGIVHVADKIVRLRLTQSQLAENRKPGWIIIIQDITEQEREEKQRKDFVANVSHELKTPLTTISGYSETLLDWGLDGMQQEEVRTYINRIHDDAVRMDSLVQDLLLLSSIDSRGIRPKMGQYDIVSIMKQVVGRMQVQAVEKEIQLESSVLSLIPPVFGDASAIDRVLTNLISNGIKYTERHGYVSVSIQLTNDYISMKVADNGMGVAKDNLPRLFHRFYRVDSTGSRKYGGTGLGLSIAKELTEIQGGTISVSSVLGKGTEFVITIPKAEKTYRETLTAVFDGSPRHEIVYENAAGYLQSAASEIEIPVSDLSQLTNEQVEELLAFLLTDPEDFEPEYNIVSPSEMLPARYEAAKRTQIVREQSDNIRKSPSVKNRPEPIHKIQTEPGQSASLRNSEGRDTRIHPDIKKSKTDYPPVPSSAVRRASMESTGELKPAIEDKPYRPQRTVAEKNRSSSQAVMQTVGKDPRISRDQLEIDNLRGKRDAKLSNNRGTKAEG
jgi:signal transduction histidine kinase